MITAIITPFGAGPQPGAPGAGARGPGRGSEQNYDYDQIGTRHGEQRSAHANLLPAAPQAPHPPRVNQEQKAWHRIRGDRRAQVVDV